jgi:hypothetical protein
MPSDQQAQAEIDSQEHAREVRHVLNKAPHFSDADIGVDVDVDSEGRIVLSYRTLLDLDPPRERTTREGFWGRQTGELRTLAETDDDCDVRRAALALLRYAEGATMKEAVEAVPYGIGWLRGLRECVREEGVAGLKSREYRSPREGSGQHG